MPLHRKFQKADKNAARNDKPDAARRGKARGSFPKKTAEQDVAQAFQNWIDAVSSGTPDTVAKLYAADSVLLPTLSPVVHDTPEKRQDYFERFLARKDLKGTVDESRIRVFGDIATNSGTYTFTFRNEDGQVERVPARFSFVYRKEEGEWKIIEHHSSAAPAGNGPALQTVLAAQDNRPQQDASDRSALKRTTTL